MEDFILLHAASYRPSIMWLLISMNSVDGESLLLWMLAKAVSEEGLAGRWFGLSRHFHPRDLPHHPQNLPPRHSLLLAPRSNQTHPSREGQLLPCPLLEP